MDNDRQEQLIAEVSERIRRWKLVIPSIAFLEANRILGNFHIQFNIVDSAELRDARLHPEKHPNLMVRVAGYCALFTSLIPEVQDAIIARTEQQGL